MTTRNTKPTKSMRFERALQVADARLVDYPNLIQERIEHVKKQLEFAIDIVKVRIMKYRTVSLLQRRIL